MDYEYNEFWNVLEQFERDIQLLIATIDPDWVHVTYDEVRSSFKFSTAHGCRPTKSFLYNSAINYLKKFFVEDETIKNIIGWIYNTETEKYEQI